MKKLILAFAVCGMMAGFASCKKDNCTCKFMGIKIAEYTQEDLDAMGLKCSDINGDGAGWSCK